MKQFKKIINVSLIVLLLISTAGTISGQTYSKEIKSAEKAFYEGRYKDALDFYEIAARMVEKPGKEHLDLYYLSGYCAMRTGDYRKAMTNFARYLNIAKRFEVNLKQLTQVKEWNDWCAIELTEIADRDKPTNVDKNITLTNLSAINSAHNDMGAMLIENNSKIIMSSNKMTVADKSLTDINYDIYISQYKKNSISEPLKVKADFNSKNNEVSSAYHEESKTLYYTVFDDKSETADIYMCKKINDHWADPVKLPSTVNSKYWDGYPGISKNGKILYFSSNRPGGQGGKDIYFSVLQDNGTWGEAKNIGFLINTRFDEITPFIDSTGTTIYFSSNGHLGVGGFDILYSSFEASNLWGDPKLLPYPINTENDEIFYIMTSIQGTSLFSSNRRGGKGVFDIYLAESGAKTPEKKKDVPVATEKPPADDIIAKTDVPVKPEPKEEKPVVKESPVQEQKPAPAKTEQKPVVAEKPKTTEPAKPVAQKTEPAKPVEKPKTETPQTTAATTGGVTETQLYNAEVNGLSFKVQIGAFRNHITVNHTYFTSKLNPNDITEEQWPPDPLYKYTTGSYSTIAGASEFKKEIRAKGYSDAFLTCYYNQKRISMDEAKDIIRKYYKTVSYR